MRATQPRACHLFSFVSLMKHGQNKVLRSTFLFLLLLSVGLRTCEAADQQQPEATPAPDSSYCHQIQTDWNCAENC